MHSFVSWEANDILLKNYTPLYLSLHLVITWRKPAGDETHALITRGLAGLAKIISKNRNSQVFPTDLPKIARRKPTDYPKIDYGGFPIDF